MATYAETGDLPAVAARVVRETAVEISGQPEPDRVAQSQVQVLAKGLEPGFALASA